jgi:hypothetical protein
MNKYLTQLQHNISMVKEAEDTKKELRDTGVIGALGVGSNLISDHIQNRMGLNGVRPPKAPVAPIAERLGGFLKNPGPSVGNALRSPGLKRGLKVGAIGGGISLLGDYAAIKINKALEKKAMDNNKYLEKIAGNVQEYRVKGIKDTRLAKINTATDYASMFLPGMGTSSAARYVAHGAAGRDLKGAFNEETRASATALAKGTGYGLAGAGLGALAGKVIGKKLGNERVGKFIANKGAQAASFAYNAGKPAAQRVKPHQLLNVIAQHDSEGVRKFFSNPHLGAHGGAMVGAVGGLAVGGTVGAVKGNYDGRLKSIRNQINDGRLANVINTQKKK